MQFFPTDPTSFSSVAESLPEELLSLFALAVISGRWPDGRELLPTQLSICQEVLELRGY